jgi:excisionase family DNA binding protein
MATHPGATGRKSGDGEGCEHAGFLLYRRIPPQDCAALPINDAAEYLGVSRSQTYNLLRAGLIKSVHIGSRNVVLRSSCDEYLKSLLA